MRKYFGTDGVRGVANKELTCDLAYKLGRAGGYVLTNNEYKVKVVVGKDTRQSGDMLEAALIAGLMSVGCDVITVGVIPTPGVAYLTRKYGAECGVVISASHNPMEDNGIKFFNKDGFKLDTAAQDYVDYLKSIVDTDLTGLKVVLDCANGAAYKVAPEVFRELGAEVIAMNVTPDGENINHKCGSTHPEGLQKAVVEHNADLGLAYDGDADRVVFIDELGNIINGDYTLAIISNDLKNKNRLNKNTIVGTILSNLGLLEYCKNNDIEFITTNVGDKYVLEYLRDNNLSLGGEEAGHIILKEYCNTGDGPLTSLIMLSILASTNTTFSNLTKIMHKYPEVHINIKVNNKNDFATSNMIEDSIKEIKNNFNGNYRLVVRPSGTEPLVRIVLEGEELKVLEESSNKIKSIIKNLNMEVV